ncbi:hypothetical protein SAMN03159463_04688 [Mesorhizobium sp. NFR06]|nr:hypothetical protein SAMN03159463_04688 [Mesorhizobium sp. NFR06]
MTKSTRLYADDAEMYRLFEKELFVADVGDVMDSLWLDVVQRAAHTSPRRRMVRISGTSNSLATWPSDE